MAIPTDIGTALLAAFAAGFAQFFAALPSIIGAVIVLAIVWILSGILAGILTKALRAIRVNDLAERAGVTAFMKRASITIDPAGFLAGLLMWYVRLVGVLVAANAVGLTTVSNVINQVLAFLPNVAVAVLILAVASWVAGLAKRAVSGAVAGASLPNAQVLGSVAQYGILFLGISAALAQLNIAAALIQILFTAVVAAAALAVGLAFGLGGRETATEMLKEWRGHAGKLAESAKETPSANRPAEMPRPADRQAPNYQA